MIKWMGSKKYILKQKKTDRIALAVQFMFKYINLIAQLVEQQSLVLVMGT